MSKETIQKLIAKGEGLAIEFKRCSGRVESDTFETICAFLNRFGGDVLLGVENDGAVSGVSPKGAADLRNNVVNAANNPALFDPVVYLDPEIVEYDGKTVIRIHVPASADVHRFKGVVFDRDGDADVRVRSTPAIAAMILRKQNIFTERRVFPFVSKSDLRLDLLARLRTRAQNRLPYGQRHPWLDMDDDELLRSARLYGTDRATGQSGFNLAAVVLLGTDEVIGDVCPVFGTDALLRVRDVDRYDDRDIVATNLVESYDRLLAFAAKHLPDPFFLEGAVRISLRDIIVREMIANTLAHREFTSNRPARFIIERGRMFTENACRASQGGAVTAAQLEPDPKNPIIAAFFREIGFADQLGSGVRKLMKYARSYGGYDPVFEDGDIFRVSVLLPDVGVTMGNTPEPVAHEIDSGRPESESSGMLGEKLGEKLGEGLGKTREGILKYLANHPTAAIPELANHIGISTTAIENNLAWLKGHEFLRRIGPARGGHWEVLR